MIFEKPIRCRLGFHKGNVRPNHESDEYGFAGIHFHCVRCGEDLESKPIYDVETTLPTEKYDGDCNIFEVLSNSRRLEVIEYLEHTPEATKDELAKHIADEEGSDRRTVYVALHQTHLDTLDEAGVISYTDRDVGVRRGPEWAAALAIIKATEKRMDD